MNNCSCCGLEIPEGQSVCSMCYGDIGYGSDGYYQQWAEEQLETEKNTRTRDEEKEETNETSNREKSS